MNISDLYKNAHEFVSIIRENIMELELFSLACFYKDICMNDYEYCPTINKQGIKEHLWRHKLTNKIINMDIIRYILTTFMSKKIDKILNEMMSAVASFTFNDIQFIHLHRKISKLIEIGVYVRKGRLYKEFIDLYKNGYLV